MKSTELRNAIETEAPTAALIWVVSAVSRDKFPCFRFVEISERKRNQVPEYALAQIGDDALTQRGDEIETRGARQREHRHDDNHHREIAVDEVRALAREPEIDHASDRDRHKQCGDCGDHQRHERRDRLPAIARNIGQKRQQRLEPAALLALGGGHDGVLRLVQRWWDGARGVSIDYVHFNRPFGGYDSRRSRRDNASSDGRWQSGASRSGWRLFPLSR